MAAEPGAVIRPLIGPEANDLPGEAGGAKPGLERKQLTEESRAIFRQQFRKTQLCRFYKGSGCQLGQQCKFAHGREELQKAPDLRRTSICTRWVQGDCPESAESCTFAHGANYLRRTIGFAKPEKEEKTEINGLQENVDVVDVATGTPPAWLPKMFELEMLRQQESTLQLQQMIQDQQQQIEILKNQLLLQEQVQLKMVMNPGTNPSPPPAAYKVPYVQPPIQAMSPMSPATAATTMSCDLRLSL
mmetsp:Transcript_15816/g.34892  ORF Transcript_15816/g.34892 Transcript_15816/m.34892 type:complete len:245 (+) Transcript_15816:61-795(+)